MSHFGILSSFDHTIHTWQNYKQRISQWFIANDIDDEKDSAGVKRRAILLSALNDGTYQLAADLALPKELTQVPYEDIVSILDRHFTPKKCGFGERYKFYAATQEPDEKYSQWAARLRGLTTHCGFLNVEEAIRDRFVMGMQPGPEKDKLFARDLQELTLARAVELAESVRSARQGAAASSSQASAQQPAMSEPVFKIATNKYARSDKKEMCQVCGYQNHKTVQCRFASYKCRRCNKTGHLRRMCKNVNFVGTGASNESDDDGRINKICSHKGEPMTLVVSIRDVNLEFELDTGSAVTAISELTYKKYFKSMPLSLASDKLFTYTGRAIHCLGIIKLPFTYLNKTYNINVRVIREGGPPILGRDFISLFKLQMSQINFTQSDNALEQLKLRYPTVFSDELGMFTKYRVKLQLKDGAKPVFFKARPIAFALKDKVNSELDRLIRLGVLKPVQHSEYASPIVPILKRDGSVRLCVDYSVSVNKQLVVEQYPLPTIRELFTKLHGGQQFTKLDLTQAYSQFLLDDASQNITCINTHRGLFKYTRLVFGLASAPAIFQRAMECLLSGLDGVMCMLDDICITGVTQAQHLDRLNEVLKRLQDAGLTLRKDKCVFFAEEIEYLGYTIDRTGLRKSQQKVKAILEAPIPTNVNKLQSFLGLVNYYRNFVPNASSILSPLYSLLQKDSKWKWDVTHNNAFNAIKKCLASEQILAHFNHNAKIILTVDASPSGLGAILSQVGSDGLERPVSFASRTLNTAEKRYSQIQKEATAIIFGVRRFHQYLYGRATPFILRTDHKPLLSIFGSHRGIPEVSANRLQRYAMFLSGYNYTIEYIRSADNSADYLSRASLPDTTNAELTLRRGYGQETGDSDSLLPVEDRASYVNFVIDGSLPITLKEIHEETLKDPILCEVIAYVTNGWPRRLSNMSIKPYFLCKTQLAYENGCVMRGHKIVIPESMRTKVLSEIHKSHLGIVKTKAEARSRFWFPGVDKCIENMIASCAICLQLRQSPARAPPALWPHPPQPFYRIHIDFLGPIHNRSYLVIVDAYSKWVEVYDMGTSTSTLAVIGNLYEYMARFGLPHTLVSDNGTQFTSQEFKTFCLCNGISHVTSPAYHPASNGQAESYVKVVKKGIKSCILSNDNVKSIQHKLCKYLFDYRNSIHSTTGCSPAQLVFGHKLRSRLDIINVIQPSPASVTLAQHVENKQSLQSKAFHKRQIHCFESGDHVLYKVYNKNKQGFWNKGVIVKRMGKVVYIVKDSLTSCEFKKHNNQLIPYKGTSSNLQQSSNCPIEFEDITSHKTSLSQPTIPGLDKGTSSTDGEGREELLEKETQANKSTEDEEFYEAIEAADEVQEVQESSDHQRHRLTKCGKILRPVPRVDYKRLY